MNYTQADVDKILEASEKADKGDWRIRKTVDESGDYPFPTYDIMAIYEYGPKGIGCAYQDPYNAILFAGAPILVEEVKRLRAENERLHSDLVSLRRECVGDAIDRTL